MGFRFRRSIKLLPGLRLNVGTRGVSASFGVRGAHITVGKSGTRATVGIRGTGLSYTHFEKSHPVPATASPHLEASSTPRGTPAGGYLTIGLVVIVVVFTAAHLRPGATVTQDPAATEAVNGNDDQAALQAVRALESAQIRAAALGAGRLRHTVANSKSFKIAQVTAMPEGSICYRFQLSNSRGIPYVRRAVMEGTVLTSSTSSLVNTLQTLSSSSERAPPL